MTIVSTTLVRPLSAESWPDLQKQLAKACEIVRRHGGENVTVLASVVGGPLTNTLAVLSTAENFARYGEVSQAVYGDPEMQALMVETGKNATWETYLSQTIEV